MICNNNPLKPLILPILLALSFMMFSCDVSDNDVADPEDDLSEEIRNLVDDELLKVFEDELNIPVHRGTSPPDLVNTLSVVNTNNEVNTLMNGTPNSVGPTVVIRPMVLLETLVPDDPCASGNCNWYDLYIRFSDQDMETQELTMEMTLIHEPTITPTTSFISGEGNTFTIFVEQVQEFDEGTVTMVGLFSGILTADGIDEPHYAGIMIENSDIEERVPNGTGQSFIDGNGFAQLSEWPEDEE